MKDEIRPFDPGESQLDIVLDDFRTQIATYYAAFITPQTHHEFESHLVGYMDDLLNDLVVSKAIKDKKIPKLTLKDK